MYMSKNSCVFLSEQLAPRISLNLDYNIKIMFCEPNKMGVARVVSQISSRSLKFNSIRYNSKKTETGGKKEIEKNMKFTRIPTELNSTQFNLTQLNLTQMNLIRLASLFENR